jgi:glucosamine kinase
MILIAESGSTKTDWVVLRKNKSNFRFATHGFNPNYYPLAVLEKALDELILHLQPAEIKKVFYYGAGCSSEEMSRMISTSFAGRFENATVEIHHDLFASARALFQNGNGLASVLGTGSSTCLYENHTIINAIPSTGYLLGDEGSGFHLGKMLLNALLRKELPGEMVTDLQEKFEIRQDGFIQELYAREKPNAFIASFVPFIHEYRHNRLIDDLVKSAFRSFFRENICKYPDYLNYELGFTGSVAYLFKDKLMFVAGEFGCRISKILKSPLEELIDYHKQKDFD